MSSTTLPSQMQAWQKPAVDTAASPVSNTVPVPSPGSHEILLRILAAGVCHSDSYLLSAARTLLVHKEPFTLGHEGCGEIVSLGPGTDSAKFRPGQRVSVVLAPGCKAAECTECKRGLERLCKRMGIYGFQQQGFFAPYVVVKDWAVVPVPGGEFRHHSSFSCGHRADVSSCAVAGCCCRAGCGVDCVPRGQNAG